MTPIAMVQLEKRSMKRSHGGHRSGKKYRKEKRRRRKIHDILESDDNAQNVSDRETDSTKSRVHRNVSDRETDSFKSQVYRPTENRRNKNDDSERSIHR